MTPARSHAARAPLTHVQATEGKRRVQRHMRRDEGRRKTLPRALTDPIHPIPHQLCIWYHSTHPPTVHELPPLLGPLRHRSNRAARRCGRGEGEGKGRPEREGGAAWRHGRLLLLPPPALLLLLLLPACSPSPIHLKRKHPQGGSRGRSLPCFRNLPFRLPSTPPLPHLRS